MRMGFRPFDGLRHIVRKEIFNLDKIAVEEQSYISLLMIHLQLLHQSAAFWHMNRREQCKFGAFAKLMNTVHKILR